MSAVLILGATSAIARAAAAAFAAQGHTLFLASRDTAELERDAADLQVRHGVPVHWSAFDARQPAGHKEFFDEVVERVGELSGVVLAFGFLGDQTVAVHEPDHALAIVEQNYSGAVSILTHCAAYLEERKAGFIIGIGSVAGDRGRQSNYVYGSAKGALGLFLQGLRNRLAPSGVRVITVKPGFVDTAMTFGKPGMFLVASPHDVGARIARTVHQRGDVRYLPWFWRYIMLIIRSIPEPLFKRLKL